MSDSKKMVRCIDGENLPTLTVGKVYEVEYEINGVYGLVTDYGYEQQFYKKRFVEVAQDQEEMEMPDGLLDDVGLVQMAFRQSETPLLAMQYIASCINWDKYKVQTEDSKPIEDDPEVCGDYYKTGTVD